jgi:hypothetical protein
MPSEFVSVAKIGSSKKMNQRHPLKSQGLKHEQSNLQWTCAWTTSEDRITTMI